MFRNTCSLHIVRRALACAATLAAMLVLLAPASAADKLPSGVTYRLKKIDKALKDLEKRKGTSRGDRDLAEAKKRIGEILKTYAKYKAHPDVAARQKQIDAAAAAHEALKGKAASDRPRTDALEKADHGLKSLEGYIARRSLASAVDRVKEAGIHLRNAKAPMEKLLAAHPQHKSHADVVAMQKRIKDAEDKFDAFRKKVLGAAAAKKSASAEKASTNEAWIAKLKPYLFGDKRIQDFPCYKAETAKKQLLYVQEATDLLDACKKAKFPQGRSEDLEKVVTRVAARVKKAPEVFKKSAANVAKQAGDRLGRAKKFLGDASWKKDPSKKPIAYSNKIMKGMEAEVDAVALIVPKDDPRLVELRKDLLFLHQCNQERRDASIDRNLIKPDKYKGKDLAAVKAKAKEALLAKHKDAKVLRQTVISSDWQEMAEIVRVRDAARGRDVLRRRVTWHLTAQIAAKRGSDCFLYTLDVSRDMRTDGSWGPLRSHLMFTDRMLEKNVNADASK